MALKIYNSLTRNKEDFKPLQPPKVSIYVCGPTVYNLLHVGNFRGPVFFNLVRNWLETSGYQVTYALNFTDVDDKIINRANEEGKTAHEVSEHYIAEYKKDFFSLGLKAHDMNPKVSDNMEPIKNMISDLIRGGKAYEMNGDVNYSIHDFPEYGKLSHRKTEELLVGVRIDASDKKKNPLDFALWKKAKDGEPYWDSPWGKGRPGWHIECSAMVCAHLGDTIDIHGGGLDLLFPHHENEVAQSEGATGKQFVKTWMHWNFINFSGQKMSKSLGNIISLREFTSQYPPEVYKWLILSSHYRSVMEFGEAAVNQAIASLARVYSAMALAEFALSSDAKSALALTGKDAKASFGTVDPKWEATLIEAWKKVEESLNDDFNTPEVFAVMFDLVRQLNGKLKRGAKVNPQQESMAYSFLAWMKKLGGLMALFQESPSQFLHNLDDLLLAKMNLQRSAVDAIVAERFKAREQKDFAKSDELRKKLQEMNVSVSDLPTGSYWEVTK